MLETKLNVTQICSYIGIPSNLIGYHFITSSIEEIKNTNNYRISVTKQLYPTIAKKFNTTSDSIERSIRHAIQVASKNPLFLNRLEKLLGFQPTFTKGDKPTNSELLTLLATHL